MPSTVFTTADHATARRTIEECIDRHRGPALPPLLVERGIGPYRGYAELLEEVLRITGEHGGRISLTGRSVRGEPLVAVHLGSAKAGDHTRTSVIVAGLHPIEWIGVETGLALLERLVATDLGDRSVIVIPIANPDGLLRVERNLRERRRRFVRHNAHGVDLNRNFDARWGHRSLLARLVPWVFRPGSYPASEPEVAAITYALGARRVDRALSLHSFGGVVLYPSNHSRLPVADAAEHRRWARAIGAGADRRPYRALPSAWFSFGLTTMGGLEIDWFHERHGALSLLVECSRGGISLHPRRALEPFAWFNPREPRPVAIRIADATLPFVRGDARP